MTIPETPSALSSTLLIRHESERRDTVHRHLFWIEDVGPQPDTPLISVEVLVDERRACVGFPVVPDEHAGLALEGRLLAGVLRQLASDGVLRVDLDEGLERTALADLGRCGFTRVGTLGRWEIDDAV